MLDKVNLRVITLGCAALLVAATLGLAFAYELFVPIQTDGGWYSYPGYALSEGRDPSENLRTLDELANQQTGVRAKFGWDNRFLLVAYHSSWFHLMGHSRPSLVTFGLLQWLALGLLVFLNVQLLTKRRILAAVATLAALSDSWIISESLADLRPDVPLAILGLLGIFGLVKIVQTENHWWGLIAGACGALAVLMHPTGVIVGSILTTLAASFALLSQGQSTKFRIVMGVVASIPAIFFLLRQRLLDLLLPTVIPPSVEQAARYSIVEKIIDRWAAGAGEKLSHEATRWLDYLFISNAAQALLLAIGLGAVVHHAFTRGSSGNQFAIRFAASLLAGVAVITILNPHFTSSHLVSIVSIAYVCAVLGLAYIVGDFQEYRICLAFCAMLVLAATLKTLHAASLTHRAYTNDFSITAVYQFARKAFPKEAGTIVAIAPTRLWPYVPPDRSVVIVDENPWSLNDPRWSSVDLLMLDDNLLSRGWGETLGLLVACDGVLPVGQVGNRTSGDLFIAAYRIKPDGCAGTSP